MPDQIREEGFLVFQQGNMAGGWFGISREQAENYAQSLTNTNVPIYVIPAVVFTNRKDRITLCWNIRTLSQSRPCSVTVATLQAEVEYRRLLAEADLIFGIDEMSGKQSIVFGRLSLEELVRAGQSNILGVVNVGVDQETMEIEKLATLVQDIKGHHDYYGAGAR